MQPQILQNLGTDTDVMGLVIGMDEAGYGPNLGPLVVTATAWDVAGAPEDADFWSAFNSVVSSSAADNADRLHVADSKVVYSPARGLKALETSVLCLLKLQGTAADSFHHLCRLVTESEAVENNSSSPANRLDQEFPGHGGWTSNSATCDSSSAEREPWYDGRDVSLPVVAANDRIQEFAARWKQCCRACGIHLRAIRSEVVGPKRFNELTRASGSKGLALSRISLRLLRRVWEPNLPEPTLILADKHGARNRYDGLLDEVLDGQMIFRQREGKSESRYRVGSARIRFAMKAESHFPVAVSSMISKYIREVAMILFNQFWADFLPSLKPTKGYPVDARRFKKDIEAVQSRIGISDDVLWRER